MPNTEMTLHQLLLRMSAATIDRLLEPVREAAKQDGEEPRSIRTLRKSISVRTFRSYSRRDPSEVAVPHTGLRRGQRQRIYQRNAPVKMTDRRKPGKPGFGFPGFHTALGNHYALSTFHQHYERCSQEAIKTTENDSYCFGNISY